MKKLWPFKDDCAKLNGNVAAAPHFATFGHVFGALSGAKIMHTISLFESQEVKSLVLQTACDLDLKRRSYDHLKESNFAFGRVNSACAKFSHNTPPCAKFSHHSSLVRIFKLPLFQPKISNFNTPASYIQMSLQLISVYHHGMEPLSLVLSCSKWGPLIIFVNIQYKFLSHSIFEF